MARILVCIVVALVSSGCEIYAGTPAEGRFDRTFNVNGTPHLDIKTASGGIRIEDPAGDVHVAAGSGGIRLTGVRGPVAARVGSGGISIEGKPLAAWDLRTGSGGIRVHVDDNTPFTLDAQVRSGGIHSD